MKKQPFASGNWWPEIVYGPTTEADVFIQPTGCTSLALYALLRSGVPADDPVVQKGFAWLQSTTGSITRKKTLSAPHRIPNGTYEASALVLALEARVLAGKRPDRISPEDLSWMRELLAQITKRMDRKRGWSYGFWNGKEFQGGKGADPDVSATSLAVSALAVGEKWGLPTPDLILVDTLTMLLDCQEATGPEVERKGARPPLKDRARGWGYRGTSGNGPDFRPTGSMTASALHAMRTCSTILKSRKSRLLTPALEERADRAWSDGLAWLDRNWSVTENPGAKSYHHFWLFALERLADGSGLEDIRGRRWYEEGAAVLLGSQDAKGSWSRRDGPRPDDLLDTAFALLFLGRATPGPAPR